MEKHSHLLTMNQTKELLFAGSALFTVKSLSKDLRFTFKIKKCDDNDKLFFCSFLNGSDNWNNYKYFGCFRVNENSSKTFTLGSKIKQTPPSVNFFNLFMKELYADNLEGRVEIWHEGKCLKCGRRLTTPESIERGIGPECFKKMAS